MEKFHGCMIFLLFAGKLSRLYSNSKHLIANKKEKFTGKPSRLEANPRKPRKFSTVNDLHYTVCITSICLCASHSRLTATDTATAKPPYKNDKSVKALFTHDVWKIQYFGGVSCQIQHLALPCTAFTT